MLHLIFSIKIADFTEVDASKRDGEGYDNESEKIIEFLKQNIQSQYVAESFFLTTSRIFWWHPKNQRGSQITAKGYFSLQNKKWNGTGIAFYQSESKKPYF